MLTARELGDIRNMANDWLPGTAIVLSDVGTRDTGAGHSESWQASGTVSCRVRKEQQAREVEIGGAIRSVVPVPISLPWDCGVNARNRLTIDDTSYEVLGTDETRSEPGQLVVTAVRMN